MRRLSLVLLVAIAAVGCKKKESAPPQVAQAGAPEAAGAAIKGKVLERLDAPPYSYLKLQTAQGEAWAAVPKAEVAKDTTVPARPAHRAAVPHRAQLPAW